MDVNKKKTTIEEICERMFEIEGRIEDMDFSCTINDGYIEGLEIWRGGDPIDPTEEILNSIQIYYEDHINKEG